MDEVAPALGATPAPLQRNAANKLAALHGGGWLPDPAATRHRLRALGRSRACLFHCRGLVRRADRPGQQWMTAGWFGADPAALRRYRLGERLAPDAADVADVALFYDRVAADLMAARR